MLRIYGEALDRLRVRLDISYLLLVIIFVMIPSFLLSLVQMYSVLNVPSTLTLVPLSNGHGIE